MSILAIDPGTHKSGFVVWNGEVRQFAVVDNEVLRRMLTQELFQEHDKVAIEMVASYGMPVGREVFETCVWIGRFVERCYRPAFLVYRKDVKLHLCGSARAKDGNIRQALIDKHGPCGTKKAPGKLYGISGHLWAALAVADYAASL
jgi:hypothetical protein